MDDQRLAGEDLERGRGIEVVVGHLPVRCRALIHLIGKNEEVLHRYGNRIEVGHTLMGGERHLEHAVFAREHDRLVEFRPDGGIEGGFGVLRRGWGPGEQHPDRKGDEDAHHEWPQDSVHGRILPERPYSSVRNRQRLVPNCPLSRGSCAACRIPHSSAMRLCLVHAVERRLFTLSAQNIVRLRAK